MTERDVYEVAELMLEASSRVWAEEWARKDLARELVLTFGEPTVRAAARLNGQTHRSWLKWAREAGEIPEGERQPDRSPQYQVRARAEPPETAL